MKDRTFPFPSALNPYTASVQFNQGLGKRQAQTCPMKSPTCGTLDLCKGIEDTFEILFFYADTRIFHRNFDILLVALDREVRGIRLMMCPPRILLGRGVGNQICHQVDFTAFGREFHCI